ncbi:MAG: hypothetical protein IPN52_11250 [Micrococcales bacterium]|nr:hypothetical protein [Micrococcales bacterium]
MNERIAAAQAAPDDWLAWYWVGGLLLMREKKQARAASGSRLMCGTGRSGLSPQDETVLACG